MVSDALVWCRITMADNSPAGACFNGACSLLAFVLYIRKKRIMSIVKRKSASGSVYYFNTATKKFASEAAYKKQKAAPLSRFKTRAGGKPSAAKCSTYGRNLTKRPSSAAGRNLKRCD